MKLGNLLRQLRIAKRLSQQEVAEQVGVCQSTYFAWENDRSSPNARHYVRLATAFSIDLKELNPNDSPLTVLSSNGSVGGTPRHDNQALFDELTASHKQIIQLQQQRIQQLETENRHLWEQVKQIPGKIVASLPFIISPMKFIDITIELIEETIVFG